MIKIHVIMEENTPLQEKLNLLEKLINELKEEKNISVKKESFSFPKINIWLYVFILLCIIFIVGISYIPWISEFTRTIGCVSLVLIVLAIGHFTYVIFELDKTEHRLRLDSEMSIYKEREMLIINLRKSLANKVLDSISFEDKKDGSVGREKSAESDRLKLNEQYDHEERVAIIKALGNNCSKESISAIQEKIKDIQKIIKEIHNQL